MIKYHVFGLALVLLGFAAAPAESQDLSKPIKIMVGTSPGSPTDFLARLAAKYIAAKTGAQTVVENRFGASGTIAMGFVANSKPDGSTLGFGASGDLMITQYLVKQMPYNPLKALVPVALVADTPQVLTIGSQLPARNVREFVDYAKANPGKINYASSGLGSTTQLGAHMFSVLAGVELTHVLYRSTTAAALDMIAGLVQMMHSSPVSVVEHVRTGKLRILAVARAERSPLLPDVPSASEVGFPGYVTPVWFGLFAPSATPKPIVDKFNALMRDMVDDPAYKQLLTNNLFGTAPLSADDFQARVAREALEWARIVRAANIEAR